MYLNDFIGVIQNHLLKYILRTTYVTNLRKKCVNKIKIIEICLAFRVPKLLYRYYINSYVLCYCILATILLCYKITMTRI